VQDLDFNSGYHVRITITITVDISVNYVQSVRLTVA